jgi:predicted lipoprotein with Yx(FWY)xxD motif
VPWIVEVSEVSITRTKRPAVLLAAMLFVVGACSSAGTPAPAGSTPPAATSSAAGSASASGGGTTYTVNQSSGAVGSYLTGEDGKTLYVKKGDTTAATNCTGACLTAWPPFTLDSGETVTAGSGVSGTLASFQRPEGTTQVTYNGQPLYYFSKDTKAGDTNGQGVAGVWSVAAP